MVETVYPLKMPGSEIVALEASVFGDPCHHARADLGLLVKSKLVVGPARPHKKAVRSTLAFGAPPQVRLST